MTVKDTIREHNHNTTHGPRSSQNETHSIPYVCKTCFVWFGVDLVFETGRGRYTRPSACQHPRGRARAKPLQVTDALIVVLELLADVSDEGLTIQTSTRVLISLWGSLMFGRVPGTRPEQ